MLDLLSVWIIYMRMAQCQCLTKCNQQCKNTAKPGSDFCLTHKNCGQSVTKPDQMDAITIFNISGTDPDKEFQIKVYLCKHSQLNHKIRSILIDLYQSFIDHIDEMGDGEDNRLKEDYKKILFTLLKSGDNDYAHMDLPYDPVIESQLVSSPGYGKDYDPDLGVYSGFKWPSGGAELIALDYHTSYDRHYFLDIDENIKDEIDITVHEH